MKLPIAALLMVLAVHLPTAAQSQTVWRCGPDGRSYSDAPCDQGRQLALAANRPAADVQAARERAAQEQKAADTLLNERLQREAAVRSMGVSADRPAAHARHAAKPAHPLSAKAGAKAKRPSAQPADAGIFRAVAPASPRKKG